jgi:hypothetical protein
VVLHWQAAAGARFNLESSRNLKEWQPEPAEIVEMVPGTYRAVLSSAGQARFYRVRQ